jgi:hypothetical protein
MTALMERHGRSRLAPALTAQYANGLPVYHDTAAVQHEDATLMQQRAEPGANQKKTESVLFGVRAGPNGDSSAVLDV